MDITGIATTTTQRTGLGAQDAQPLEERGSGTRQISNDSLANKEAFLQLLVAQIKNQDPLNPTNGLEFLTQLAQFSELEQMIGIRDEIQALRGVVTVRAEPNTSIG